MELQVEHTVRDLPGSGAATGAGPGAGNGAGSGAGANSAQNDNSTDNQHDNQNDEMMETQAARAAMRSTMPKGAGIAGVVPGSSAEESAAVRPQQSTARRVEMLSPFAIGISAVLMVVSGVLAALRGGVDLFTLALFLAGIASVGGVLLAAMLTRAYSPALFIRSLFKVRSSTAKPAAVLAGRDILRGLGLAEQILDADPDARLVTTRDGVVVFGNSRYMDLARDAGVIGLTGLPPRMDRLFGQALSESSKMFRLARAARSGMAADEIVTQTMGAASDGGKLTRRRFEVSVRPVRQGTDHVAWRLREVPVENARDALKTAYMDYPRAIIALEKSGALAWFNMAAMKLIGTKPGAVISLADFMLGEPADVIEALWQEEPEEAEARIRQPKGGEAPISVILSAFGRGGIGEGFVCVEMTPRDANVAETTQSDPALDMAEAPFGVAIVKGDPGTDAVLMKVNALFAECFSVANGDKLTDALPAAAVRDLVAAVKARQPNQAVTRPFEVTLGEGASARNFRVYGRPIKRRRGAYGPRQLVLYAVDVSWQKRMEEDYAHDKRLKTIGKIAGGVAHDFNNFLMAMMGATELLMRRHPAGDPSYPDLVSIRENGQRARNLTQNLLAFSRKQTLRSEVLFVGDFLADFAPFVQRYVTEKVRVDVRHGRNLPPIKVDKSQLELAIMNLAVNARDAMERGGTLTIASRNVPAAEVGAYNYPQLDEIDYALIEVSDNGTGVPEEIAEKIFEPFFTTKGEGKGTGLGLSTVHGVIGQMGGRIFLYNQPGKGATFRIFFPALSVEQAADARRAVEAARVTQSGPVDDLTGKGRILIVEDEDSVRNIVVRSLAMCGYEIVEASDGDEALEIIEDAETPFDVLLSDIMMPEMDGPTLVQEAGNRLNGTKVIFMSGYAEAELRDKLDEIGDARYLQKPFTLKKVAATVKEALSVKQVAAPTAS